MGFLIEPFPMHRSKNGSNKVNLLAKWGGNFPSAVIGRTGALANSN
jgi:hypothetical protein